MDAQIIPLLGGGYQGQLTSEVATSRNQRRKLGQTFANTVDLGLPATNSALQLRAQMRNGGCGCWYVRKDVRDIKVG